jgi:hypothetical protein
LISFAFAKGNQASKRPPIAITPMLRLKSERTTWLPTKGGFRNDKIPERRR